MLKNRDGYSLFDIAQIRLNQTKNTFSLTDILDVAISIRKFLDLHPKRVEKILSGQNRSPQLQYYYNKKKMGLL